MIGFAVGSKRLKALVKNFEMNRKHNRVAQADIVLEILNRIPVSGHFVTVDMLLNSLKEAGIDIGRRSLQRYLKKMYESGNYGIVRDDRDTTYAYRRDRTAQQLDSIQLKPNECLLLKIAHEQLKYQLPAAVLKSLDFLFSKADDVLNKKGSESKENQWPEKVCIVSASLPQKPAKIIPRIFDAVSEALYSEVKLDIEYTNMSGKTSKALISPLGLVQQDGRLYLVCKYDQYDHPVHLALHRLKRAKVTVFSSERPKCFNLQRYVDERHFNFSNGEQVLWVVEFQSDILACNLNETPFNDTQKLTKSDKGWHMEVKMPDSPLLDGWVATWKESGEITKSEKLPCV